MIANSDDGDLIDEVAGEAGNAAKDDMESVPVAAPDRWTMNAAYRRSLKLASALPVLTADDERHLARQWRDHRDFTARDELIGAHLRLVPPIASRYLRHRHNLSIDELVAEGNFGLLASAYRFNPELGVRFSVCAKIGVEGAIRLYLKRSRSIVRHPVKVRAHIGGDESLNEPIEYDDGEQAERIDNLADVAPSSEDIMIARQEWDAPARALGAAVERLPPHARRVFEACHLTDEPVSYVALAKELGLCRQTVSAIATRSYNQVRDTVRSLCGAPAVWPSSLNADASQIAAIP